MFQVLDLDPDGLLVGSESDERAAPIPSSSSETPCRQTSVGAGLAGGGDLAVGIPALEGLRVGLLADA